MKERWKEPREGSEIDPEIVCLQSVGACIYMGDGVLFVERSSELISSARLSQLTEPQWKRAWIGRWHLRTEQNTLWTHSADFGKVKFVQRIYLYVSRISQSQNLAICAHRCILSSVKVPKVLGIRPETGWPNHEQAEATVTCREGPNRRKQQIARMICG